MAADTLTQYNEVIDRCRTIYEKKVMDYGTAWRILRPSSITDQIFIKATRIRTLQENEEQKVEEGIESEFMGIINYGVMALLQLDLGWDTEEDLKVEKALSLYDEKLDEVRQLMKDKNHDYGEAWRDMRVSSMTDLILMKLLRIKKIEDNEGKTLISEPISSGYSDIVNYAAFSMIQLTEEKE